LALVVLPRSLAPLAAGALEHELDASDVRGLVRLLEVRFPGIASKIDEMAIAIDGEIISDPLLERIDRASEVHFLPRIQGG
jgi:hypothetical protein